MMKISKPQIISKNEQVFYRVNVESVKGKETLWYSLDQSFGDLVSTSCDAALVALLIPAMANGEDIQVEGPLSERLFINLAKRYQVLLQRILPTLKQVKINAKDISSGHVSRATGVATGFSGGIDSYCALADYYFADVSHGFKITHLLFNNVGSHGRGGEQLFQERYKRLLPITESLGLPFLLINSNLPSFYDKEMAFQKTASARNVSVALLLQRGIGRYMYASSNHYNNLYNYEELDAYDTVILPLLSTESLDAFSIGSEYTRVEKTTKVAEIPESYRSLDVCANPFNTSGYINCSTCYKCRRTLATLEIAGLLERYSGVFDNDAYRKSKPFYFATLPTHRSALARELMQFARQRNYSQPILSHLIRPFYLATNLVGHTLKAFYQKL